MPRIYVTGSINAGPELNSPGDGAYSLLGSWELDEFLARLRETLSDGVKPLLCRGRATEGCGHTLHIEIVDECNKPVDE